MNIKAWILAARPKTLTAALVPILVSSAWVYSLGKEFSSSVAWLALMASIFIQVGTNLFNDAIDFKKGADQADRLGPKRMAASGNLTYPWMIRVAVVCLGAALLCGIPLVLRGGGPILAIGLVSMFLAYGYTGGPFPLAYKGLGDLFVVLFFGLIPVAGCIYLQIFEWPLQGLLLGAQVGLHCAVLIAINNLRDIEGDRKVGKKTLAVRLGAAGARSEIAILIFLPFFIGLLWIYPGYPQAAVLPWLMLPLALKLVRNIFRTEPSETYNQYLGQSAALHLGFGILLCVGFLLAA